MRAKEIKAPKLILYGQSLGGAVMGHAVLDSPHYELIDLLVFDSTFSSYQDIAFKKIKSSWPLFIFSPLAYLLVTDKTASQDRLPKINKKSLVIHGTNDTVVEYEFGEEIFQLLPGPKWFWAVDDGVHTDVFFRHEKKYRQKFLDFIKTEI